MRLVYSRVKGRRSGKEGTCGDAGGHPLRTKTARLFLPGVWPVCSAGHHVPGVKVLANHRTVCTGKMRVQFKGRHGDGMESILENLRPPHTHTFISFPGHFPVMYCHLHAMTFLKYPEACIHNGSDDIPAAKQRAPPPLPLNTPFLWVASFHIQFHPPPSPDNSPALLHLNLL